MSVVLFCALSYNRDLQGKRCGYDCVAVSTSTAKAIDAVLEVIYKQASVTSQDSLASGMLSAEVSYGLHWVTSAFLDKVPVYETCYLYLDTFFVHVEDVHVEVALPRYIPPVSEIFKSERIEACYDDGTVTPSGGTSTQESFKAVQLSSLHAEYSCQPLAGSGKPKILSPYAEVAYSAVPQDNVEFSTENSFITASKFGSEVTYGSNLNGKNFAKTGGYLAEIAYTQSVNDDDNRYATGLSAEVSYAFVETVVTIGIAKNCSEFCYHAEKDYTDMSVVAGKIGSEVTFSTWSGNISPAVQQWQVVVGDAPRYPIVTDDTVYIPCTISECIDGLSISDGTMTSLIRSPSSVTVLSNGLFFSGINHAVSIIDKSLVKDDTILNLGHDVIDAFGIDNGSVMICGDGTAVIIDATYSMATVQIPSGAVCAAYHVSTQTYCIGTRNGFIYFLSRSFVSSFKLDLKGPIVQIQATQYGTTPCFVISSQGSSSIVAIDALSGELVSAIRVDGTITSGNYNVPGISYYATTAESSNIFKSKSNLTWFLTIPSIKGKPRFLTAKGSREYFSDVVSSSAGWL